MSKINENPRRISLLNASILLAMIPAVTPLALAEQGFALEEVIVTAEKKAAAAQDTAITMDVVSGNTIQREGIKDLESLSALTPSLNFQKDTINTSFTLRGIGSSNVDNELGDQAVTVSIDGEYLNRPVALNVAMFDLERVEVLRGPQGTLYGRNATAGAVNIVTARPELGVEKGSIYLDVGNYNARTVQGMVNLPISDQAAVRAALTKTIRDGYRDAGPAGKVDDADAGGIRLGLTAEPTDSTSIYIGIESSKMDQTAPSRYGIPLQAPFSSDPLPAGTAPSGFNPDIPDEWDQGIAGFQKVDQKAIRTQIDQDFESFSVTYLGSYRKIDLESYQPLNGFVPELFNIEVNSEFATQNHELRIQAETDRYFWQAGLFYGKETQEIDRGVVVTQVPVSNANSWLNHFLRDVNSETKALFAQGTYHLTDTLDLNLGGRYTKDTKDRTAYDLLAPSFVLGIPGYPDAPDFSLGVYAPTAGQNSDSWGEFTWQAGLDYHVAENSMIFAKISTGYKAGGYDAVGSYEPETITAYEVGSKNELLERRLRLNASVFYYDYQDQQISVLRDLSIGNQTLNAGATTVKGIDLESQYLLSENDVLSVGINYLDATFDQFPTTQALVGMDADSFTAIEDYLAVAGVDLTGNTPPQSPNITLSLGYEHIWQLDSGELSLSLNSVYKSKYYLSPFNWEADKQDAHTQTSLRISYDATDNWSVSAYARNLEDEQALSYSSFTGGPSVSIYNFAIGSPRVYGVHFNYNW